MTVELANKTIPGTGLTQADYVILRRILKQIDQFGALCEDENNVNIQNNNERRYLLPISTSQYTATDKLGSADRIVARYGRFCNNMKEAGLFTNSYVKRSATTPFEYGLSITFPDAERAKSFATMQHNKERHAEIMAANQSTPDRAYVSR